MKQSYRDKSFRADALARIRTCNEIIDEYMGQGLRLTLRQLYYQLVSRDLIANAEREYNRLATLVSEARLAGMMDWEAIEDRTRRPVTVSEFTGLPHLVDVALRAYRLPRWKGQDCYVELWVEKDALAGVLAPLADEFHVTLMVNRGYSSTSSMYDSAQRLLEAEAAADGQPALHVFYLGDHDPSGEDMVRDIAERLEMFGVQDLEVRKLALTRAQIRQYRPPPNPAKITDPRAAAYIAQHGPQSWEVDALPPQVLAQLIRDAFEGVVDQERMDAVIADEDRDKAQLRAAVQQLGANGIKTPRPKRRR